MMITKREQQVDVMVTVQNLQIFLVQSLFLRQLMKQERENSIKNLPITWDQEQNQK